MPRAATHRRFSHWLLPATMGALAAMLATYALLCPKGVKYTVMPVEQGVLYRSPQLSAAQLAEEVQRLGIKTVVNLGSVAGIDEPVCGTLGVRYLDCPVGDVWWLCGLPAPGSKADPAVPFDLAPVWKLIDDPAARPVLIHCKGGTHRTGVVTAMHRIRAQGWQAHDAIAEMDLYGFDSHKSKFANVLDYLREYADQSRQAQAKPAGALR